MSREPDIRRKIRSWFSKLQDTFSVTSEYDARYNCFAFAVHDNQHWWEYDAIDDFGFATRWPSHLTEGDSVGSWIEALQAEGFEHADDGMLEADFEKIAIYAKYDDRGREEPTHVARQEPSGIWKSKLGRHEDIEHHTPEELCGYGMCEYGVVVHYLKRRLTTTAN